MIVFAILPLLALATTASGGINQSCAKAKGISSDIRVHGRLALYNGGYPNHRLWQIGTKHLFGIYGGERDWNRGPGASEEDLEAFPANVEQALKADDVFSVTLFGDFLLRPLQQAKPGAMQAACIVSAIHLVRQTR